MNTIERELSLIENGKHQAREEVFEYLLGKCPHSKPWNARAGRCIYCIDALIEKLRKGERP